MANKLHNTHPLVFQEILEDKYEEDFLYKLTFGSAKKIEWQCKECSYIWTAAVRDRTRKGNRASGCPECREIQRIENIGKANIGVNDLKTTHPQLYKEIDFELNTNINIEEVKYGSGKKIWWRCSTCTHKWESTVAHRTYSKKMRGCPKCANVTRGIKSAQATIGVNDLKSTFPKLFNELDPVKNGDIDLSLITFGSSQRVWWKCSKDNCNRSWITTPLKRTWKNGTGCPRCTKSSGTSYQEKELLEFITIFIKNNIDEDVEIIENDRNTILNAHTGSFLELDIYIPELSLAFEYNGNYWHSDANIYQRTQGVFKTAGDFHRYKSDLCDAQDIKLVHVNEKDWVNDNDTIIDAVENLLIASM